MELILLTEDTLISFNSYLSLEEADGFKISSESLQEAWTALEEKDKTQYLIQASALINNISSFGGCKYDEHQSMAFPRADETGISLNVKLATFEMVKDLLFENHRDAVREEVGSIKIEYDKTQKVSNYKKRALEYLKSYTDTGIKMVRVATKYEYGDKNGQCDYQ